MNTIRAAVLVLAVLLALPVPSLADTFPAKPIRLVVPAGPGTSSDRYARLLALHMTEALKQSVVVDNRPGAGGNIAAETVARSPPDGYTLIFGSSSLFATNPHVYRNLAYDARRDFVPVAPFVRGYMYLFVPAQSPANTLKQFIELAKAKQGKMNYGSLGVGSNTHLAMEELKHRAGFEATHIPYKAGTPETIRGMIAGELDAAFDFYTPVMAQVRAGKLKALAITAPKRNLAVPDIPTFAENGFAGFEHTGWAGVFAPAGTPGEVIETLRRELLNGRASSAVQRTMREAGALEMAMSPEEFRAFLEQEYERGAKIVKLAGATIE
jgi:tripartite-type tricarboxylate transporter receptor subunit TctC